MRRFRLMSRLGGIKFLAASALLVACVLLGSSVCVAQRSITLAATPSAVRDGTARKTGPFNPQQMLRLTITLRPPHPELEEELVQQILDPSSPRFHQFLSDEEWNERFAPPVEDEKAVIAWTESQGLTLTHRYSNRLMVDVEAPVAVIQKAFAVTINTYRMGGTSYFSNDTDPSVPASLANAIRNVIGLNNMLPMRKFGRLPQAEAPIYSPGPAYVREEAIRQEGKASKWATTTRQNPATPYQPSDLPDVYSSFEYNFVPLRNLGHCCNPLNHPDNSPPESSIAIAIWGDYSEDDFHQWIGSYQLAGASRRVLLRGARRCNQDPNNFTCDGEATLDVEYSTAMANSFGNSSYTAAVYVYEGVNGGDMLAALNHIMNDGLAKVVSMSWGGTEAAFLGAGELEDYHAVFRQMAGKGITLLASSGDGGATTDCLSISVSYPSSDPYVTSVGGTTLQSSRYLYTREVTWSGGPDGCSYNDGGTGGGCSMHFDAPAWQAHNACGSKRSVPDISLNADYYNTPQPLIYRGSTWWLAGGTSLSSPEMAGFIAQENAYLLYLQSRIGNTCGPSMTAPCAPLGPASPFLHNEGNHQTAPHYPFYDITTGCNGNDITERRHLTPYCAGPGYDEATGWGSANMLQLAWAINYAMAGDNKGPVASFTGPPTNQWYRSDQTVTWTITDQSANSRSPNGVAGASFAWDSDPGDPYSQPTPGTNSNWYGPQFYASTGSASGLANLSEGCHYAMVRPWDNAGNSQLSQYGPICYDVTAPWVTVNLNGNGGGGQYTGPVLVSLTAGDNASGVAATYIAVDYGDFTNYSGSFYVYLPGNHCIEAYAVDVAGNTGYPWPQCFNIRTNDQYTVSVTKQGTGQGSVTSMDGRINCGSTCSATYFDEQPITLTASPSAGSIFIGWRNCDVAFGFSCTATITAARTITAVFNVPVALQFVPLPPCRVVDTRLPNGPYGGPAVAGGTSRDFAIPGGPCPNIPANAAAYSLNVTTVPQGYLGYLSLWAKGYTRPLTSIMNSFDGRIKATAAILAAGDSSSVSVYASNTADVILDIDGYFVPPSGSTLAFFPLTPCRVIDTRGADGPLGGPMLVNNQVREFPVQQSSTCAIPAAAQAYSFNVTAIPYDGSSLAYLAVWPAGRSQPVVSTLNALTGTVTANAAIVPAGTDGSIDVLPSGADSDLVVDINGYFAPQASGSNPLSLYAFTSCRVLDTRQSGGAFSGRISVNVTGSGCQVPSTAQGYVFNATVLPSGALGYLTLWPDGQGQPSVSTLNALDGAVTSNMAIVPTTNGSIDAYAAGLTQLLLDIASYFAP